MLAFLLGKVLENKGGMFSGGGATKYTLFYKNIEMASSTKSFVIFRTVVVLKVC